MPDIAKMLDILIPRFITEKVAVVILECETVDQVERIVELLGLILDEAGVCEMEYIVDRRSN